MQDTLQHLVSHTVKRSDSRKFLYILNQIDTSAREDNPEEVVGAWQRSVAQAGLISGKFYGIFNRDVAPPIEDPIKRARYEAKCDEDLAEIHARMTEIEFGRGYRIVGILDALAKELEGEVVPRVQELVAKWRRLVLWGDAGGLAVLALLAGLAGYLAGGEAVGHGLSWLTQGYTLDWLGGIPARLLGTLSGMVLAFSGWHWFLRTLVRRKIAESLPERFGQMDLNLRNAFRRNTGLFSGLFRRKAAGWNGRTRKDLFVIREAIAHHVQVWNDNYTDPTGAARRPGHQRTGGGGGRHRLSLRRRRLSRQRGLIPGCPSFSIWSPRTGPSARTACRWRGQRGRRASRWWWPPGSTPTASASRPRASGSTPSTGAAGATGRGPLSAPCSTSPPSTAAKSPT